MSKNFENIIQNKKITEKISNYLTLKDLSNLKQCSKSVYRNLKNKNIFLNKLIQNSNKP
jgi:hypothetical protein